MSEKEKQIIETFALIIPKLSENDKSYLLGLGEGMAIKVKAKEKESERLILADRQKLEEAKLEMATV